MNEKLKNCKACEQEIGAKVKKCPHCGEDQRSFFGRHKFITFLLVVLVLGGIGSLFNKEEKIEYIDYNYGDMIAKENVQEGAKFEVPEGLKISIDSQEVLTKEDINKVNEFNDANNDVSVITVSMENDSEEPVDYNVLGLTYVTKEGVKLDEAWGDIFQVLPEKYESMDSFGSGELMPGSKFTRILAIEIPENDPIKKIEWDYVSIRFIVELPE